jgi:hypothetical protein
MSSDPAITVPAFELSVRNIVRERVVWPNQSGAGIITAGTALVETVIQHAKQKSRLIGVQCTFTAAVAANASNFFTMIVRKRTVALPGTQVTLLTYPVDTPGTDDFAAWTMKELVGAAGTTLSATATDLNFGAGDVLTLEITKTGTGLSVPIGEVTFIMDPRD